MRAGQDADLQDVVAIAKGDRNALGALYDRYSPLMVALGLKIFRSRDEAEDVLHDVFVEVWKRAGSYDARRGTVKTWLFLRMRSRCLDRVRSAAYARRETLDAERDERGQAPDLERDSDGHRARQLLQALPIEQRQVLELGYYGGLSSSEIAERLQIPVGTVKSRVAAGLAKLRRKFTAGVSA